MSGSEVATFELDQLQAYVGRELGISRWFDIDQRRIDSFAGATEDRQWIHVDESRSAAGPFGQTIAHGYLTLSLCAAFMFDAFEISGVGMAVNYGLDRVRFLTPVPAGSRVRGSCRLKSFAMAGEAFRAVFEIAVELEGSKKPAALVDAITLYYRA